MSLDLIPLATARLSVGAPIYIPDAPGGTRVIASITAATWTGERFNATQVAGAPSADWAFATPDGVNKVDVRSTLQTADGAIVQVAYYGRARMGMPAWCSMQSPPSRRGIRIPVAERHHRRRARHDRRSWRSRYAHL